jgi:hypothetical protein
MAGTKVEPVVGERFESWLHRWAETEGRELFAERAAAMHRRVARERERRAANAMDAFEALRDGRKRRTVLVSENAPTWRKFGEWSAGVAGVASVFDLARSEGGN